MRQDCQRDNALGLTHTQWECQKKGLLQQGSTKEVFGKKCTVKVVLQARAMKGSDNWETSLTQRKDAFNLSICPNYSNGNAATLVLAAKMYFFVWQTKSNPSAELRSILAEFTIWARRIDRRPLFPGRSLPSGICSWQPVFLDYLYSICSRTAVLGFVAWVYFVL